MNIVKAKNPVKAWEYLVEGFLLKKPEWFGEGVGYNITNSLFTYDMCIEKPSLILSLTLVSYSAIP